MFVCYLCSFCGCNKNIVYMAVEICLDTLCFVVFLNLFVTFLIVFTI